MDGWMLEMDRWSDVWLDEQIDESMDRGTVTLNGRMCWTVRHDEVIDV